MALTRDQKIEQVKILKEKMESSASVVFAHYIGLDVADISDLRRELRKNNAEMRVAKKTLMRIAGQEAKMPDFTEDDLEGAVACIFSFNDPLTGAQIAFKFAKNHEQVKLIGGIFEGKILSAGEAIEFAKMPGRQELLGKFAGIIRSPLYGFAGICSSPLSGFARALSQLSEKGGFKSDAENIQKNNS